MIGTSYRGPVRRSVFHYVRRTQRAQAGDGEAVYKRPPNPAVPPSGRFICNGRSGSG
ncbi:unnamed protein product [Staurois parvus]|uniref:Uncharacterized protein n=1 Tax=Staurois parvus TaxID=386267 RepID=A0ABN9EIM8_9NEOB|nr:unnamed protein product [Staurois parvus]